METIKKLKWVLLVLLALIFIAGGFLLAKVKMKMLAVNATSNYQAVFLTNGQVYFGKLSGNGPWLKLTNIYYLQATQPLQQGDSTEQAKPSNNIQLVKLGSELHGPTDEMNIDRDKILFWENLKDDSKVVQAIRQYQAK